MLKFFVFRVIYILTVFAAAMAAFMVIGWLITNELGFILLMATIVCIVAYFMAKEDKLNYESDCQYIKYLERAHDEYIRNAEEYIAKRDEYEREGKMEDAHHAATTAKYFYEKAEEVQVRLIALNKKYRRR